METSIVLLLVDRILLDKNWKELFFLSSYFFNLPVPLTELSATLSFAQFA
jgi:hypothetical protein